MKYIRTFFIALMSLTAWGQPTDFLNRKQEIDKCTGQIYSIKEFQRIADSMQMSVSELSDYPVIFPIKKPVISSGFGMRKHPVYKVRKFHTGIDIPKIKGTPVYATGNGVVSRKGYNSGYGYFIEVEHSGNFHSFYAHLSRTLVNVGDSVTITQQIACVGNTGVTTGSHLHYEVRKDKRFLNPAEWCYCLSAILKNEFINEKTAWNFLQYIYHLEGSHVQGKDTYFSFPATCHITGYRVYVLFR
jgi:murein DD-endopeptidase MepM/ murein hydrolase activator NlpD